MESLFEKLLSLLVAFILVYNGPVLSQSTFHSTPAGGQWSNPATWVENAVPSGSDDVIIGGPVFCNTNYCHNITVDTSGYLYGTGSGILTVYGDLINDGMISDNIAPLNIKLYGNLMNNGIINNHSIVLRAGTDQYLSQSNDHPFETNLGSEKPSGKTVFLTDMEFVNCLIDMQGDSIMIPDSGFVKVHGGHLQDAVVFANAGMDGRVRLEMNNLAYISGCEIFNPEITGTVRSHYNTFYGDVLVNGILENDDSGYTLTVDGDITNNGTVRSVSSGNLTVSIYGDLKNNGVWNDVYTRFPATDGQHITCLNGNDFSGGQFFDNTTAADTIFFDDTVHFDGTTLYFDTKPCIISPEGILTLHNAYVKYSSIKGKSEHSVIYGLGSHSSDCPRFFQTSLSSVFLKGEFRFDDNCSLYGPVVNTGAIYDLNGSTLKIYGEFYNEGIIADNSQLILFVYGNITNDSSWTNYKTYMQGSTPQIICLKNQHYYYGLMNFVSDVGAGYPSHWYWNDVGITQPYPPVHFDNYQSTTLELLMQLDDYYLGYYYFISPLGTSRTITVTADTSYILDVKVIPEGAYSGTFLDTSLYHSGLIPVDQPFGRHPWNYYGYECVSSIPDSVVDWVLLEFRDAPTASQAGSNTVKERKAAFLKYDHTITGLDGITPVQFDSTYANGLFLVVYHRNHIPVMSSSPLSIQNSKYSYDFTLPGQAYGDGEKNINGVYVMYGGDANADGKVNDDDRLQWKTEAGKQGYLQSDLNVDGQADNKDKDEIWIENNGIISVVPE